jgi:hypothetical protein
MTWEVLRIFGIYMLCLVSWIAVASLTTSLVFMLGLMIMGDDTVSDDHEECGRDEHTEEEELIR